MSAPFSPADARRYVRIVAMLLVLGGITGCGYKGPLTRPAMAAIPTTQTADSLTHPAGHIRMAPAVTLNDSGPKPVAAVQANATSRA